MATPHKLLTLAAAAGTFLSCWVGLASSPAVAESMSPSRAPEQCPAVTIIAARGSEQNENLEPTRYHPDSPWVSNGYEEENLRALLQAVEARHPGVMKNVQVLPLDAEVYPASLYIPRIAEVDEDVTPQETLRRVATLLSHTPPQEIAATAINGLSDSVYRGVTDVPRVVAANDAALGCHPQYIFLGYSQGAVILEATEKEVQNNTGGRLRGAVYLGNPLLAPGDPSLIGQPGTGHGVLGDLPVNSRTLAATDPSHRVNYCLAQDFACDGGLNSASTAMNNGGGAHANYFLKPGPGDNATVDALARWIKEASQ
ncbi:hypothetical protein GSS88_06490 [Corynebacterium sp. 3HC-13]|uniref:hypothetical protein n=1 Tax=Corynebacterium poyangense TaxID=2684405 RepID=UPI001CCCE7B5|nr:hypothetical protein [Corynebacterium poyangense]MBZ8177446.1 hypothetical protein [Corynebacterium poyangense]